MKRMPITLAYSQLESARKNFLKAAGVEYNHQDPRAQLVNKAIMHLLCGFDSTEGHDTLQPLTLAADAVTEWHTQRDADREAKGTP